MLGLCMKYMKLKCIWNILDLQYSAHDKCGCQEDLCIICAWQTVGLFRKRGSGPSDKTAGRMLAYLVAQFILNSLLYWDTFWAHGFNVNHGLSKSCVTGNELWLAFLSCGWTPTPLILSDVLVVISVYLYICMTLGYGYYDIYVC